MVARHLSQEIVSPYTAMTTPSNLSLTAYRRSKRSGSLTGKPSGGKSNTENLLDSPQSITLHPRIIPRPTRLSPGFSEIWAEVKLTGCWANSPILTEHSWSETRQSEALKSLISNSWIWRTEHLKINIMTLNQNNKSSGLIQNTNFPALKTL